MPELACHQRGSRHGGVIGSRLANFGTKVAVLQPARYSRPYIQETERRLSQTKRTSKSMYLERRSCQRFHQAMQYTILPPVELCFSVCKLVSFLNVFFNDKVPNLAGLCKHIGIGRGRVIARLFSWLVGLEAQAACVEMAKKEFSGVVEIDGAGLRMWRDRGNHKNVHQALLAALERPRGSAPLSFAVFLLPKHHVCRNGVCPVESREDVLSTGALKMVKRKSMLMTDGARCYERLAKEHGLRHTCVSHCKGEFAKATRIRTVQQGQRQRQRISTNTGLVEQLWSRVKSFVPGQIGMSDEGLLRDYVHMWWLRASFPCAQERMQMVTEFAQSRM